MARLARLELGLVSVRRQGNGKRPWRVRYYDTDGRGRMRSFPTKALALEFEREQADLKARVGAGLAVTTGPIAFDDLAELYLASYTAESKPWLERMLRHPRARFGSVQVHLLRPEQIGRWLHSELELAPKTKNHILTAFRQVLNAGVEWGYLTVSPARPSAVKPPRGSTNPTDVRPLESWAQVLQVAEQIGHYGPLVRFACATGLRPQEWAALEWGDVDRANHIIHVRRALKQDGTVEEAGKTAGALRAVTLSAPARRALDDTVRHLDQPRIFSRPDGTLIRRWGFAEAWHSALAVLELDPRPPYQMRHTFATLALAQGCTLEWVGKELGHRDLSVTRKYYARFLKVVDDRMRALLDQMEEEDDTRSRAGQTTP